MDIEINTSALKSDANKMAQEVQALKETMSSMNDAVISLSSMWEGEANLAFTAQYMSDYENMKEMCAIVDNIIECMNYAVNQYGQCDDDIRNIISALRI